MKLVQKQFLKGSREFEIVGDAIQVRLKSPFRQEKLTVMLAVLDPDPVVNRDCLEFRSRVESEPLLSLLLDKPNKGDFDNFVDELKRRVRAEHHAFAGLRDDSQPEGMAANVFDEPPEFDEPGPSRAKKQRKPVRIADIEVSTQMLRRHLDSEEIEPLLAALEALQGDPDNEANFGRLVDAFEGLGPRQGAVLTYAPYIGILLSDDPFGY